MVLTVKLVLSFGDTVKQLFPCVLDLFRVLLYLLS